MPAHASCLIRDAAQIAMLQYGEPSLTSLSFYADIDVFLKKMSQEPEPTIAFVPADYVGAVLSQFPNNPVLAYGPASNLSESFRYGVCDYLKEPWDAAEFWARVSRYIDRDFFKLSWAEIHADKHKTTINGHLVRLRPGAQSIFVCLLRTCGKVVLRKHLLQAINMRNPRSRLVDVYVAEIRTKIGAVLGYAQTQRIVSHPGAGYSLDR